MWCTMAGQAVDDRSSVVAFFPSSNESEDTVSLINNVYPAVLYCVHLGKEKVKDLSRRFSSLFFGEVGEVMTTRAMIHYFATVVESRTPDFSGAGFDKDVARQKDWRTKTARPSNKHHLHSTQNESQSCLPS